MWVLKVEIDLINQRLIEHMSKNADTFSMEDVLHIMKLILKANSQSLLIVCNQESDLSL